MSSSTSSTTPARPVRPSTWAWAPTSTAVSTRGRRRSTAWRGLRSCPPACACTSTGRRSRGSWAATGWPSSNAPYRPSGRLHLPTCRGGRLHLPTCWGGRRRSRREGKPPGGEAAGRGERLWSELPDDAFRGHERERHAVPGEAGADVYVRHPVERPGQGQPRLREAHGPRPAMRDLRAGAEAARRLLEMLLDSARRLSLIGLLRFRRLVAPPSDQDLSRSQLAPVAVPVVRVDRPVDQDPGLG